MGPRRARLHVRRDLAQRVVILDLDGLVRRDAVVLAQDAEDLRLLHGVNAQICLHVEVRVKEVARVAGLLGDERDEFFQDLLDTRAAGRRRSHRCRRWHGRSTCLWNVCRRWLGGRDHGTRGRRFARRRSLIHDA